MLKFCLTEPKFINDNLSRIVGILKVEFIGSNRSNFDLYSENLIKKYYEQDYTDVHYRGLMGVFTSHYHRVLERTKSKTKVFNKVLDIGGGSGEHLTFAKIIPNQYTVIDPNPNINAIQKINLLERFKSVKIVAVKGKAEKLPFKDESFDRVIFSCVLLHVENSVLALEEAYRVLKKGGVLSIYLPSDPGFLYRLIRHVTSHRKLMKKSGMKMTEIKFLWSIEHRNHTLGILNQIKYMFRDQNITVYGFPSKFLSWNLSLFKVFQIEKIK